MSTPQSVVPQAAWSVSLPLWRVAAPLPAVHALAPVGTGRQDTPSGFRRSYSESEREGLAETQRYLALRARGGSEAGSVLPGAEAPEPLWHWNRRLGPEILAAVYTEMALPAPSTGQRLDVYV